MIHRLIPALILFVLAPVIAEASIGTVFTPGGGVGFLFLMPIYGGGALLIREIVVRLGGGYPSIFLFGLAYGVIEEGLALASFVSPTIYEAIGPRWGGVVGDFNGVYTLFQLLNHALFSITVPIALVELCFSSHRRERWTRVPGLIGVTLLFAVGIGLTRLSTVFILDPHYSASIFSVVIMLVAMAAFAAGGVVLARNGIAKGVIGTPPSPGLSFALAALWTTVALGVLGLGGDAGVFEASWQLTLAAVALFAGLCLVGVVVVRWWGSYSGFSDLHRFGLVGGSLVGHQIILGVIHPATVSAYIGVGVVGLVMVLALYLLGRMIRLRSSSAVETSSGEGW